MRQRDVMTHLRKIIIGILGAALIGLGLIGLVAPFLPGWLLIIAGLAVLSTEYVWARRLTDGARRRASMAMRRRPDRDDLAA